MLNTKGKGVLLLSCNAAPRAKLSNIQVQARVNPKKAPKRLISHYSKEKMYSLHTTSSKAY